MGIDWKQVEGMSGCVMKSDMNDNEKHEWFTPEFVANLKRVVVDEEIRCRLNFICIILALCSTRWDALTPLRCQLLGGVGIEANGDELAIYIGEPTYAGLAVDGLGDSQRRSLICTDLAKMISQVISEAGGLKQGVQYQVQSTEVKDR